MITGERACITRILGMLETDPRGRRQRPSCLPSALVSSSPLMPAAMYLAPRYVCTLDNEARYTNTRHTHIHSCCVSAARQKGKNTYMVY